MMFAPLAPGLAGDVRPIRRPGRDRGRNAGGHGPVFLSALLVACACGLGLPLVAAAQQAPQQQRAPQQAPSAGQQAGGGQGAAAPSAARTPDWRRTDAYVFGAIGDVTRRMQFVAQAMQLRDYCADRRVPDEFVQGRLQQFGRMTGREETCTTLLDY